MKTKRSSRHKHAAVKATALLLVLLARDYCAAQPTTASETTGKFAEGQVAEGKVDTERDQLRNRIFAEAGAGAAQLALQEARASRDAFSDHDLFQIEALVVETEVHWGRQQSLASDEADQPQIVAWSEALARKNHTLFLGRGVHYPIALEGALKLKEISYVHAEAYPAGELKHGPLAIVTSEMPVITIAPNDTLLEKLKSNMQEVRARGGQLYVLADAGTQIESSDGVRVIQLPEHYGPLSPILHVVPLQLLAYHTACVRGTDVDKPRNLAKSVTVE
jgi:hypothetical protein